MSAIMKEQVPARGTITVDILDHYRTEEGAPGIAAQFTYQDDGMTRDAAVMFTPVIHRDHAWILAGVVEGSVYLRTQGRWSPCGDTDALFAAAFPVIAAASIQHRIAVLDYRIDLYRRAALRGTAPAATLDFWQEGVRSAEAEAQLIRDATSGMMAA